MATPPASTTTESQKTLVSTAKGGGMMFAGRMFETVGRFGTGVILARFLGATDYGVYSLCISITAIVTACAILGLGQGVVQYVSIFSNKQDSASIQGTLWASLGIPFVVSIGLGVALFVGQPYVVALFGKPELAGVLPIVAATLPFNTLLFVGGFAVVAFKKIHYRVLSQDIAFTVSKIILTGVLVLTVFNTTSALLIQTVSIIISAAVVIYFLHRTFPLNRPFKAARFHLGSLMLFSLPVYLTNVIGLLESQIQTLLLGIFGTLSVVGIFTVALRVSMLGKIFHASIVTVTMPQVSDLYSRGEWAQLHHFYQVVTKWTFTANLPLFLLILLFPEPILTIFGDTFITGEPLVLLGIPFDPSTTTLILLGSANLLGAATGICGVLVTMTGKPILNTINSLLALGTLVGLNLLLVPSLGIIGAGIAQVMAVFILNGARIGQIVYLYQMWPYNPTFLKPVAAGLIAFGTTYALGFSITTLNDLLSILIQTLFLFIVYGGSILLLGLGADDRFILGRVGSRFGKLYQKVRGE